MKKLLLISLALALSFGAFAQTSGTGIGATVGTNINFSAKFWTGETTAFAAAIGLDYYSSYGGVNLTGDYLFHLWCYVHNICFRSSI